MTALVTDVRLLDHARERCGEMGVLTKRVKRIVRDPDVDYDGRDGRRVCYVDGDDIAVVYEPGTPAVVVTVVWRVLHDYVRDGAGYVLIDNQETESDS